MGRRNRDRNKEREKLYRKVRNNSSWRRIGSYVILIILFSFALVVTGGFILEYIVESKFYVGYSELEYVAKLYDVGYDDPSIMDFIETTDVEFLVRDQKGEILYQQGANTCGSTGNEVLFSNGSEAYMVYEDTQNNVLYADGDGGLRIRYSIFLEVLESYEDEIKVPIWCGINLDQGKKIFCGKMYFDMEKRELILFGEMLACLAIIVGILTIGMFIYMIRSVINYRRVVRLFYSDPITERHNWNWYLRNGDEKIQSGRYKEVTFAVVDLVLQNYRNYCLCHSVKEGEELLANIHKVLDKEMQKGEMCTHAALSHFALLLRYTDAEQLTQRLYDLIGKIQATDQDHNFASHIGVDLVWPLKTENGKTLKRKNFSIENAYNNACSARAALGDMEGTGIRIFDTKLFEEQRWSDVVHESQKTAIENEEFVVYYQPKYDPRTNMLCGAEALIRWISPVYGFVTPGRFIPIFEKNGFITEIDHYMISHVARDQKAWYDAGYKCVPISVNVSRAHFVENNLAEQIRDTVDAAGCPHELIEIELTESAFFDDKNAMIETIKRLKSYGFAVSMDDFGAGYSSLNSLKDMPLDVLKLDADFFRGEDAGERGEIVVSEAIRLAKCLNMRTVAEGVEEKDQVDFLAKQGCDMIQGFYFAKPMPKEEYMGRMTVAQNVGVPSESPVSEVPVQEVISEAEKSTDENPVVEVQNEVENLEDELPVNETAVNEIPIEENVNMEMTGTETTAEAEASGVEASGAEPSEEKIPGVESPEIVVADTEQVTPPQEEAPQTSL